MPDIGLYWIDDSIKDMLPIVDNVFPLLWNNDFYSKIILFGNGYWQKESESYLTKEDCEIFKTYIKKEFAYYCINMDKKSWVKPGTTRQAKEDLVSKPLVEMIPFGEDTTSDDIARLIQLWTDDAKLEEMKNKAEAENTNEIKQEFRISAEVLTKKMSISKPAVIAIDIYLLYSDDARLLKQLPILSMALFDLLQTDYPCYLYSSAGVSKATTDKWLNIYKSTFSPNKPLPEIYPKNGLVTRREDTPAKKELINLLDSLRNNRGNT